MMKKGMSFDTIKEVAPSVFTETSSPETSNMYTHIPTYKVIEDMEKLNWYVDDVKEIKARKGIGFQKHMVIFRNDDIYIKAEDGDDVFPQILLINSHNGKSSFSFQAGLFRLICSNGLVISTQDFGSMKIRHMGYSFKELQQLISSVVDKMPLVVESMNKFREKQLNQDEQFKFVMEAIGLRFGDEQIEVSPEEILKPEREKDKGDDLWVVYNRVQEKLTQGTFNYTIRKKETNKTRKARKIKNFQQDIVLNKKLYELAESFT